MLITSLILICIFLFQKTFRTLHNNLAKKIDDGAQVIVVGGAHPMHTQAIHVLLKAGLANVVITDHLTALNLLAD